MTYEEATTARVTPQQAIAELRKHFITAHVHGDAVWACQWDAVVHNDGSITSDVREFAIGRDGLVSGKAVLDWSGY